MLEPPGANELVSPVSLFIQAFAQTVASRLASEGYGKTEVAAIGTKCKWDWISDCGWIDGVISVTEITQ